MSRQLEGDVNQPLLKIASSKPPASQYSKQPLLNENGMPLAMTHFPRDEVPSRYFDLEEEDNGIKNKKSLPGAYPSGRTAVVLDQDPVEDGRFRHSLAPDTTAIRIRHIAERFRASMLVLLVIAVLFLLSFLFLSELYVSGPRCDLLRF
jgi:hypothetical protein